MSQSTRVFATIPDLVDAAEATLEPEMWDFLSGGAETEWTLRRNRAALDEIAFRPRVLRDVRTRTTSASILGCTLQMPVFLAPLGSIARFHPDGALAAARVAARTGSLCFVSANATPELRVVASKADAPLVFQVYGYDDPELTTTLIRTAEATGCVAVCITADSAVYGRRERDLRNGFRPTDKPARPNVDAVLGPQNSRAGFTWRDLERIRAGTRLPIILKGVLSPEDAAQAVRVGVDVVYVSNHGGRQLDFAPATIDVLPDIAAAVDGRVPLLVDSGYRRGTDVLKARALGATAVGLGKLQGWALAADGEAGLERTFELLQHEMQTAMALLGVSDVRELTPDHLRRPSQVGFGSSASLDRLHHLH